MSLLTALLHVPCSPGWFAFFAQIICFHLLHCLLISLSFLVIDPSLVPRHSPHHAQRERGGHSLLNLSSDCGRKHMGFVFLIWLRSHYHLVLSFYCRCHDFIFLYNCRESHCVYISLFTHLPVSDHLGSFPVFSVVKCSALNPMYRCICDVLTWNPFGSSPRELVSPYDTWTSSFSSIIS